MNISQNTKDIEIEFQKIKLKKSDLAWSVHHSKIPGFSFIYEKLVYAANQFTSDIELINCFNKHQTDNIKMHYEKQKELPDEEFYGEYEKNTMSKYDSSHNYISLYSQDSHKPITFMDDFIITPKRNPPFAPHITTPQIDINYNYNYITTKGSMLNCCRHPIKNWLGKIYKSIYGTIKCTEVRGLFWYPRGGFREWHTNKYHRVGWRLYLVYADEDEKSWFSFKHPETGKLHIIPDHTGYINIFKITEDPPIWHNVYSQTNRISLGIHVTDEFIEKFIEFI